MKIAALLLCCSCLAAPIGAQVNADSLLRVWQDTGKPDTMRLLAIHNLARSILHDNPDSARSLALEELALAREIQDKKWEGRALNVIGLTWRYRSELEKAIQYYLESIALLEAVGDRSFLAAVYGNMGDVYRVQSNYSVAIDWIHKSLTMAEALGDQKRIADACVSMAIMFYETQESNDKTVQYLLRAQTLYEGIGSQEGLSLVYGNLSSIYLDAGDYEQALLFNEKCMAIQEKRNNSFGLATSLQNRATIYVQLGRYQDAIADYKREIEIFQRIGDREGVADAYSSLGDLYIRAKRYEKAIPFCTKAMEIAQSLGGPTVRELNACRCLYNAHSKLGNASKALEFLEQSMAIRDSLQIHETAEKLDKLEMERKTVADSLVREKEKSVAELEHQKNLRKKDRAMGIMLVAGLGGALVAWAFGIRMLYFRRRSRIMQARSEALEKQQLLNEIDLLKTQVNPHFLFNSLSILSSLVHVNANLSERFVEQLARSYRYILEQKDQPLVTLRTELDFIQSYTFLLEIRFEQKFDLQATLPEESLDRYKIAPLTLQLLVENAVKHNRMSTKEPLVVEVTVEDEFLVVKNPLRLRTQGETSTGTGLKNIVNRYALLSDRAVWVGECEGAFVVKVPLLQ